MKLIKTLAALSITWSAQAMADFNLQGKGSLTYPSGDKEPFTFKLEFQPSDGQYLFSAGEQSILLEEPPEAYSIFVVKQDQHLWAQEFSEHHFVAMQFNIGDHQIIIKPDHTDADDFHLSVDDKSYLFDSNTVQISFQLNADGINEIQVTGTLPAMSGPSI